MPFNNSAIKLDLRSLLDNIFKQKNINFSPSLYLLILNQAISQPPWHSSPSPRLLSANPRPEWGWNFSSQSWHEQGRRGHYMDNLQVGDDGRWAMDWGNTWGEDRGFEDRESWRNGDEVLWTGEILQYSGYESEALWVGERHTLADKGTESLRGG